MTIFQINGRTAVVTGGANGLGLAMVEALAAKGAKVVLADYDKESGEAETKKFQDSGYDVIFVETDVSKESEIENLVQETLDAFGSLDIMVNNAGIGPHDDVMTLTDEEYQRVMRTNQDSVFYGIKHASKPMVEAGAGAIVNISSILGVVGKDFGFAYSATKGAIIQMTKSAALYFAKKGVRVNAIAPGDAESKMINRERLGKIYDEMLEIYPMGRIGRPEEIAHAVIFAVENEFLTGATVTVDGGYTAM